MNEPKRRGRPPKAKPVETVRFLEHLDALTKSHPEYIASEDPPGEVSGRELQAKTQPTRGEAVQAYARRIWSGQTPDLPRSERLKRIAAALEAQGLSMEGVEL